MQGRCILGRETAIEEIIWKNDWPYLNSGSNLPRLEIPSPNLKEVVFSEIPERENFDSDQLPIDFQTLRIPQSEEWISLTERSGFYD